MSKNIMNIHLIQRADFEFIQSLPNNGTKYLLIFDDSCEEISSLKDFVKIATAGRHKRLSTKYVKHNFFIRVGWEVTLIVLFKSHKDVLHIDTLSQQLGLGSQLKDWYTKATSIPHGPLIIDLTPKTVDSLRFWTNSGSITTFLFLSQNNRLLF